MENTKPTRIYTTRTCTTLQRKEQWLQWRYECFHYLFQQLSNTNMLCQSYREHGNKISNEDHQQVKHEVEFLGNIGFAICASVYNLHKCSAMQNPSTSSDTLGHQPHGNQLRITIASQQHKLRAKVGCLFDRIGPISLLVGSSDGCAPTSLVFDVSANLYILSRYKLRIFRNIMTKRGNFDDDYLLSRSFDKKNIFSGLSC